MKNNKIIIYKTTDGRTELRVDLQAEMIWLTQAQMVVLFQKTKQNISLHINNIFKEKELHWKSVVKESLTTAKDGKKYKTIYYNLDVIISVGYRVKSKQGTQFRIWATNILRQHLINGYTLNEHRLTAEIEKYQKLKNAVGLLENVMKLDCLSADAKGLLQVITDYSQALHILDDYDHQCLKISKITKKELYQLTYEEAGKIIQCLKKKFNDSDLVGNEKDNSFKSSLNTIYQTFGGKDLYPSVEEKASNLLYFVTKNHSFSDGNKRIAATLFIYFLQRNGILYKSDGTKRVENNTLVALTLMIAESKSKEKEDMIKVIVNLINQERDLTPLYRDK